ncbi:four-carbon acid sugar kinase family protein [uncultured Cohaesibacter sp.]|uniref:four-carbon acid sugar kinase family protein n=1 Tax=uncultured Cohaesibacter sp. TaxID=1002546 RepID=UPI0029C6593F|nr:four-carbon acid sugar kinase family protein [uncultured Cohaesibacter sp.]
MDTVPKLVIIADDLTGALDSSVAFAERGLKVVCALTPDQFEIAMAMNADIVAVSSGSREIPKDEAARRIAHVGAMIKTHDSVTGIRIFKKVDSRLKGHVATEIQALGFENDKILICPAIPRLGRFVKHGALVGEGVSEPINVAEISHLPQSCCIEAWSQDDIERAIIAFAEDGLLVGAAGLAEATARQMVPVSLSKENVAPVAPALFAIGSRDPVTLAQLEAFSPLVAPNGQVPAPTSGSEDVQVIQMTPGETVISGQEAGRAFAEGIAEWIAEIRPSTFLACGGESAAEICLRLNIGILEVLGEVLPGLPMSRSAIGDEELFVITKSGGFGGRDTLEMVSARLMKR